jgi:predicted deacetylase
MCALCVSIHDVAPATWPQCEYLLQAIRAVADIPVSLLVVPAYHRQGAPDHEFDRRLERRLVRGDELVLHGYSHLDEAAPAGNWRDALVRNFYTRSEGEFYAIDRTEARRRLALGRKWFAQRGWPLEGFVAPAWLMGTGAWEALAEFQFNYTTTLRRFHLLAEGRVIESRSLVYTVRNGLRRRASRAWNDAVFHRLAHNPLLRLGLHPADAAHPDIVRHAQRLIAAALKTRQPMTKAAFARAARTRTNAYAGSPASSAGRQTSPPPSVR